VYLFEKATVMTWSTVTPQKVTRASEVHNVFQNPLTRERNDKSSTAENSSAAKKSNKLYRRATQTHQ